MATIDIRGLVEDGLLDLNEVFRGAIWRHETHIHTWRYVRQGPVTELFVERAEAYGITVYRVTQRTAGVLEPGPMMLERDAALQEAEELAHTLRRIVRRA